MLVEGIKIAVNAIKFHDGSIKQEDKKALKAFIKEFPNAENIITEEDMAKLRIFTTMLPSGVLWYIRNIE